MRDGCLILPLQIDEQYVHRPTPYFAGNLQGQVERDRAVLATGEGHAHSLEVLEDQPDAFLGRLIDVEIAVVFACHAAPFPLFV